MTSWERWIVHGSTVLVGGTGLVYGWMRYVMQPIGPYAVINHPLQPLLQHLHVLAAPLLVFAAGLIWRDHIWNHWRRGIEPRRKSGLALLFTLIPMTISGYLIQTTTTDAWRLTWIVVHCVTACAFLLGYAVHAVIAFRDATRRRRARRRDRPSLDEPKEWLRPTGVSGDVLRGQRGAR